MKETTPPVSSHLVCLMWGFVLPKMCFPLIHQCCKYFCNHCSDHLLLSLWCLLKKAEDIAVSVLFVLSRSWQGYGEKVSWDFCIWALCAGLGGAVAHRNEGKGNWISFHQHRLNKNEHFKELESSAYVLTGDGKVVQEDFLKVPLAVLPFLSCLFSFVLTKCWSCTDVWRAPCNIRYTWHTVGSFNALFGRAGGHVLLPCRVTRLCSQGSGCAWIWGWTDGSGWDVSWACPMASTALSSSQVNFAVFCFISSENSLFWEKQLYP